MQSIFSQLKIFTILTRITTQYYLYQQFKYHTQNFTLICDPNHQNNIPISQSFLLKIILLTILPSISKLSKSFIKKYFSNNNKIYSFISLFKKLTPRILLILFIKIINFTSYQNFDIFMLTKCIILQVIVIGICLGLDIIKFQKTEELQIIIIDFALINIYIFQLTHKFCLYFNYFNLSYYLIPLCVSIIEGFAFKNSKKRVRSIFTKQDGYKILAFTFIYLIIFGLGMLLKHGNNKYFFNIGMNIFTLYLTLNYFKNNRFQQSLFSMVLFLFIYLSFDKFTENFESVLQN